MTDRDAAFSKALDLIKDHEALSAEGAEDLRKLVFQKYVEDAAQDQSRALDRARFWHNTPLVIALTGLLTIGANFGVSYFRTDQDLSGLLTKSELDSALEANNATINAELAEQRAQADAARNADVSQREFQHKILTELLNYPEEEKRARLLLFYVDAGAMEGLNVAALRSMAKQSIEATGGDPDAPVGVPSTSQLPDRLQLMATVLGRPGSTACLPPTERVALPPALGDQMRRPHVDVHEAVAPYVRRLLQAIDASPDRDRFNRLRDPFFVGEPDAEAVNSQSDWGAAIMFDGVRNQSLSLLQLVGQEMPEEMMRIAREGGYQFVPTLQAIGILRFELSDASLREIQASGYQPWDGTCP